MKIYNRKWAARIVQQWADSDPRVVAMLLTWEGYAKQWKVANPPEFVWGRIIGMLQTARHTDWWRIVKAAANHQIMWRPIFEKYVLTDDHKTKYAESLQAQLPLNK